jgi:hypothetical protein
MYVHLDLYYISLIKYNRKSEMRLHFLFNKIYFFKIKFSFLLWFITNLIIKIDIVDTDNKNPW